MAGKNPEAYELTGDELAHLERVEQEARRNPNLRVALPPRIALALIADFRRARLDGANILFDAMEATEALEETADRVRALRAAIRRIAHPVGGRSESLAERVGRMRAHAYQALAHDDRRERETFADTGVAIAGSREDHDRRLTDLPRIGETRRDALGNLWRVEDVDGDNARITLLAPVQAVDAAELICTTERFSIRKRAAKAAKAGMRKRRARR